MKLTLYTCTVCPTQVLRCFPLDTLTLMIKFFFFFFLYLVTNISLRQIVSTFYETEYLTIFFVYLLICIYVHIHTRVKIYAYVILFIHTQYNLCIVPQQKYPQNRSQSTPTLPNPHYNTPLVYIMSICIANTHSAKRKRKIKKKGKEITN